MSGVSEMIDAFRERRPALRIDLPVTTRRLLLDRMEADVAIRPPDAPPEHFIGRRICDLAFGVYSSRNYLELNAGHKRDEYAWLTVSAGMNASSPGRWMDAFIAPGRGVAMLPKAYAVRMPDLVPLDHLMDAPHATGLWLLTHPDMRTNPRLRAFLDSVGKRLSKEKKHFAG
jgi:DNA-binding transcriptional LysR family regulator